MGHRWYSRHHEPAYCKKSTAVDDTQLHAMARGATLGQDAEVHGVPRQPHTCSFTAWRTAAFRLSGSPVSAASRPVQMHSSHACIQQSASSTCTALVTLRNPLIRSTVTGRGEAWTLKQRVMSVPECMPLLLALSVCGIPAPIQSSACLPYSPTASHREDDGMPFSGKRPQAHVSSSK
jgi:hypothetical protein